MATEHATPAPASAEDYRELLERLLPPGPIWAQAEGRELAGLLLAAGDELARIHGRFLALLEEADPRSAVETLEAWERVLGLPDPALGQLPTVAERQALAHARWTARGGQSAAYFLELAQALGLAVSIRPRCQPFRVGRSSAGAPLHSLAWAHGWRVDAPNGPAAAFRAGSRVGYRLDDRRQPVLEALFWRYTPAHAVPVFRYHP